LDTNHDYLNTSDTRWGKHRYIAAMVCSGLPERPEQDRLEKPQPKRGFGPIGGTLLNRTGCAVRLIDRVKGTIIDVHGACSTRQTADAVPAVLLKLLDVISRREGEGSLVVHTPEKATIEYLDAHAPKWATQSPQADNPWRAAWCRLAPLGQAGRVKLVAWDDGEFSSFKDRFRDYAAATAKDSLSDKHWVPGSVELQRCSVCSRMAGEA
jgi:hypothetical protein